MAAAVRRRWAKNPPLKAEKTDYGYQVDQYQWSIRGQKDSWQAVEPEHLIQEILRVLQKRRELIIIQKKDGCVWRFIRTV